MAHRHGGNPKLPQYHGLTTYKPHLGPDWTGEVRWLPGVAERAVVRLALAKKPLRIVYNLMSDIAHQDAPAEFLDRTLAFCAALSHHIHIFITKRPDILAIRLAHLSPLGKLDADRWDAARKPLYNACMREAGARFGRNSDSKSALTLQNQAEYVGYMGAFTEFPLKNVMILATAESQTEAEYRSGPLLDLAAKGWHTGMIVEPMLGPVSLRRIPSAPSAAKYLNALTGVCSSWMGTSTVPGLEWLVCGMEQGPGARELETRHAAYLAAECLNAGVPFFFKKDSQGYYDDSLPRLFPAWMEVPHA